MKGEKILTSSTLALITEETHKKKTEFIVLVYLNLLFLEIQAF